MNGKIFIDKLGNLDVLPIHDKDLNKLSYYKYIEDKKKEGYTQFLLTSDMMIDISIEILSNYNSSIFDVTLFYDDDENKNTILSYFENYKKGEIVKNELQWKLEYLYDENSIDVIAIKAKIKDIGNIYIRNNGIISYEEIDMKDILMNLINKMWELD